MEFDKSKFIGQYKEETREHLQNLSEGLLKLEKSPEDKGMLESMMREAHTIKGSSTMMGYKRIADIAHEMESGLQDALDGKMVLQKAHFDILFKSLDSIPPLLEDKVTWEGAGVARPYADDLCKEIASVFARVVKKTEMPKAPEAPIKKKEAKASEPVKVSPQPPAAIAEESLRVDINKLDKLMNLSGELIVSKVRLNELVTHITRKFETHDHSGESFRELIKELNRAQESISSVTSNIQDEVMKVRMVPVSYLFNLFPRAMRDLAQKAGKDVNIEMKGENTHLDKTIIDEMRDPMMHLLRNAVDHGIESSQDRIRKGKPAAGRVSLNAYQVGSQVVVEVSDDGAGIDVAKVKARAIERKVLPKEKIESLSDEEVFQILFMPGFSTKDEVTETSGRGVGLDVVKESLTKLKGTVEVISASDSGTIFRMKMPLTLAITECLLVAAGSDTFAIPIDAVVETIRIELGQVKTVETREAITVRNQIMPLVRLNDIFSLPTKGIVERKYYSVIIVQAVEKRLGLLVDELNGRQDIVGKSLSEPLKNVKYVSGATILGDGRVILIIDVPSIIDSFEGGVVIRRQDVSKAMPGPIVKKRRKTILLAEDAISTAMLEKNVLESAGFSVVIARDGQEALEKSAQEKFDLVITDILMPRMDGFELTITLRKDKLYKNIPIIIVTTRESDADKRRGLEAGADAYILKSEFTSEGLLNTIERLIG
ncbi:MAG: chemotaxis protein CheW [Candidatus Omnitrophica bacterium]|nr:chemotaxis protein CheW [Candidatus Omnitrophota bacterium]